MSLFLGTYLFAAILATSFLSGIVGMAGGMILIGLLLWQFGVAEAMIIHGAAQFFSNFSRVILHRRHIYFKSMGFYLLGVFALALFFLLFRFVTNETIVFLILGISPFLALLLARYGGPRWQADFTRPAHAFLCGTLVAFFQLTSGSGGPLLDVFFQTRRMTRHETIATKSAAMSMSHLVKVGYFMFAASGAVESFSAWWLLAIPPVAMTGAQLGKLVLTRMDDHQFYRITQYILLVIGGYYLLRGLANLW